MTLGGEVMANRVQVADTAVRNDGRNRAGRTSRPLAPADPKIVKPRVENPSANLHDNLTS